MAIAGSKRTRIQGLDGLRGLSVSFVIFEHLNVSGALPFDQPVLAFGNLGVRIFFVISGFIISVLLLEELADSGTISIRAFYVRRFFRIVPVWAFFVGIILLALAITHRFPSNQQLLAILSFNVDYINIDVDFQHLWSLSVEEKFYLLWPALLLLGGSRRATFVAATVVVIVPLIRLVERHFGSPYNAPPYWTFHMNADALAVGCLLAIGRSWLTDQPWVKILISRRWLSGFMLMATIGLAATQHLNDEWWVGPGISILNFTIAGMIWAVVTDTQSLLSWVLNSTAIRTLGLWSYSIYLWQQPLTLHQKTGFLSLFPINVAVVMCLACISYYLIERRLQHYGRQLAAS